ncbi:MAG: hypothetical protein IJQ10_04300 [Clostridia bacterium]|nr:hypothetical protein [Clostridia bacterium]
MNSQKGILLFSFLSSLFFPSCNAQSSMNFQRAHENSFKSKIIKKIKDNPKTSAVILASTTFILGAGIGVGIDELIRCMKSKKIDIDNNIDTKTDSSDIGKENCGICLDTIKNNDNIVCCKNCYYLLHEKCYNGIVEKPEKIKLTCSNCRKQQELGEGYVKLYCECNRGYQKVLNNKSKQCPNCRAYNSYMKLDDENFIPMEKAFKTYKFASKYTQNKIDEKINKLKKEKEELNAKINFK